MDDLRVQGIQAASSISSAETPPEAGSPMSDAYADICYQQLTRHIADPAARAQAEERLRTHPHFAVLRDVVSSRDMVCVPGSARGVLVDTVDGCLLLPPHDAVQLPIIARYGAFQRDDLLRVLAFLDQRDALHGDVFVDVGANVGSHTLHAMRTKHFRRALAVEPNPENARLLKLNMRLNALSDVVDIAACALAADAASTASMIVNPFNCGDARLAPTHPAPAPLLGEEGFASMEVAVTSFDALLDTHHLEARDMGLVWMDTQGCEGWILGASSVLRESRVPLYVEFWPYGMKGLGSYAPFKSFVEACATTLVTFEGGSPKELPVTALDDLFSAYEDDARFLDLLLLR